MDSAVSASRKKSRNGMVQDRSLFPSSMSLIISKSVRRAAHPGSSALLSNWLDILNASMIAVLRDTASLHNACAHNGSPQLGPLRSKVQEAALRTFRNTRMLTSSMLRHIASARMYASSWTRSPVTENLGKVVALKSRKM